MVSSRKSLIREQLPSAGPFCRLNIETSRRLPLHDSHVEGRQTSNYSAKIQRFKRALIGCSCSQTQNPGQRKPVAETRALRVGGRPSSHGVDLLAPGSSVGRPPAGSAALCARLCWDWCHHWDPPERLRMAASGPLPSGDPHGGPVCHARRFVWMPCVGCPLPPRRQVRSPPSCL